MDKYLDEFIGPRKPVYSENSDNISNTLFVLLFRARNNNNEITLNTILTSTHYFYNISLHVIGVYIS